MSARLSSHDRSRAIIDEAAAKIQLLGRGKEKGLKRIKSNGVPRTKVSRLRDDDDDEDDFPPPQVGMKISAVTTHEFPA